MMLARTFRHPQTGTSVLNRVGRGGPGCDFVPAPVRRLDGSRLGMAVVMSRGLATPVPS
jgi:hypothetical protein